VTSLLAVLCKDLTDVNILIIDIMWFVELKHIMPMFCANIRNVVLITTMRVDSTVYVPADEYTAQ